MNRHLVFSKVHYLTLAGILSSVLAATPVYAAKCRGAVAALASRSEAIVSGDSVIRVDHPQQEQYPNYRYTDLSVKTADNWPVSGRAAGLDLAYGLYLTPAEARWAELPGTNVQKSIWADVSNTLNSLVRDDYVPEAFSKVHLTPDQRHVFAMTNRGNLMVFRADSAKLEFTLPAASSKSNEIVALTNNHVAVWQRENDRGYVVLRKATAPFEAISRVAANRPAAAIVTRDESTLIIANDYKITTVDTATGTQKVIFEGDNFFPISTARLLKDERTLAVGYNAQKVSGNYEINSMSFVETIDLKTGAVSAAKFVKGISFVTSISELSGRRSGDINVVGSCDPYDTATFRSANIEAPVPSRSTPNTSLRNFNQAMNSPQVFAGYLKTVPFPNVPYTEEAY